MFEHSGGPVNAVWASWAVSIAIAVVLLGVGLLMWVSPREPVSGDRTSRPAIMQRPGAGLHFGGSNLID